MSLIVSPGPVLGAQDFGNVLGVHAVDVETKAARKVTRGLAGVARVLAAPSGPAGGAAPSSKEAGHGAGPPSAPGAAWPCGQIRQAGGT